MKSCQIFSPIEEIWKTRSSWSRNRDVIAKAEHLPGKKNSRFIVTDIPAEEGDAKSLGDETRSMSSTIRLRMLKVSAAVKIFECREACCKHENGNL